MDTKPTDLKGHTPTAPANATHPSTPGKDAVSPSIFTSPAGKPAPKLHPDVEAEPPKEERATRPRALRAIGSDGNVLKTTDWILKRDPTEEEKDAFLRTVPRATAVDVVDAKL